MEAERRNDNSRSLKRKPLSDLTNLIPKPYHHHSFSKSKKPVTDSSISGSSIGSSKHISNVQYPFTPLPLSTNSDNRDGKEPLLNYTRRQTAKRTESKGDAAATPLSFHSQYKTTNKGKGDSLALSCTKVEKTQDKGKAIAVPLSCPPLENTRIKVKDISVPFSSTYSLKIKDKGKAIDADGGLPNFAKTKDKEKAVAIAITDNGDGDEPRVVCTRRQTVNKNSAAMLLSNHFLDKTRDNGKGDSVALSCSTADKIQDKWKAIAVPLSCASPENTKNKVKDICVPFSSISSVKRKDKGKTIDVGGGLPTFDKTKDKGKAVAIANDYLTLERNKGSSCLPLLRNRKNRNEFDKAGDILQTKSQTDPHLNKMKRRCSTGDANFKKHILPQDFIDRQRAYFKEIDEFELPEEEVSDEEVSRNWCKEKE